MALRRLELTLLNQLVDDRFYFIQRGVIHEEEILSAVKAHYPELCDDTYLSSMHRKNGKDEPEWIYTVKYYLKARNQFGVGFRKFPIPEFWEFY